MKQWNVNHAHFIDREGPTFPSVSDISTDNLMIIYIYGRCVPTVPIYVILPLICFAINCLHATICARNIIIISCMGEF